MHQTTILNIYTDGGSRGNPGEAAVGVYIENNDSIALAEIGKRLGIATNNIAEYSAILEALRWVSLHKSELSSLQKINFFVDSLLAASQLNGIYKVKNSNLREILFNIRQIEGELGIPTSYSHVPREENKKADKLVNMALDGKIN